MFHHIRSLSYNYQIRIRGRREGESGIIGMMTVMRCLIRFGNPARQQRRRQESCAYISSVQICFPLGGSFFFSMVLCIRSIFCLSERKIQVNHCYVMTARGGTSFGAETKRGYTASSKEIRFEKPFLLPAPPSAFPSCCHPVSVQTDKIIGRRGSVNCFLRAPIIGL